MGNDNEPGRWERNTQLTYLVSITSITWKGKQPDNHKLDLLPESLSLPHNHFLWNLDNRTWTEFVDKFLGGNFKHYGTEVLHEIRESGKPSWNETIGMKSGSFNVMCNAFPTVVSFFRSQSYMRVQRVKMKVFKRLSYCFDLNLLFVISRHNILLILIDMKWL